MWVSSRQFTGRIVTVSNSKIFAEPVFNYTRDFPFIWEEMAIPITYNADRGRGRERSCWRRHGCTRPKRTRWLRTRRKSAGPIWSGADRTRPRVYYRITDNWLELTVRFVIGTHDIRGAKDAMSRYIIAELDKGRDRHRFRHLRHRRISRDRNASAETVPLHTVGRLNSNARLAHPQSPQPKESHKCRRSSSLPVRAPAWPRNRPGVR